MNNRAVVADFPDSLPTKWSLSKRNKRRLKQILALVAAIVALLWLLYQLGQYTAAMGADQQSKIHIDGDRKMTVHANPGFQHGSSAGGVGQGKRIADALPSPSPGAPRQTSASDGVGSDQTAPLSNRDNQSSVPETAGTDTQQQVAAGPNGRDPLFFGYGNLPMLWIANGDGAGSSGNTSDVNSGNSGGNGGGPSGNPPSDSTLGPGDNGANILAPTVEVPEPDSIVLFGGGLLVLLTTLRRQRGLSRNRPQASWKRDREGRLAQLA